MTNIHSRPLLGALLLAALTAGFAACSRKEGCTDPLATNYDPDAQRDCCCAYATGKTFTITDLGNGVKQVQGETDQDVTLTSGTKWLLHGFVYVNSGATLTIEPGTVIKGDKDSKATLVVRRGGRFHAEGTSTQPIVFTSAQPAGQRAPGDWGGIIVCGKAPVNLQGGEGTIEGGVDATFGGYDATHSSGILRYIRIEFSGVPFQPNQEINGLTLGGVGSGTTIDHIQVSYNGDDSYEFFGGTVNVKHLVALASWDDDFDMDNGYAGKGQFLVALRDPAIADQSGSNGLEHDNDGQGTAAAPFTAPVLSNVSIFGPQATPGTIINGSFKRAGHLRRNTHSKVFNSVFAGFPTGLVVDGAACEANADGGDLKVRRCVYSAMGTLTGVASGSTWDIQSWFTAGGNVSVDDNGALGVADPFQLTAPGFQLTGGSMLADGAAFGEPELNDPFFEQVPHRGAFGTQDWTAGWCNWDPQHTPY
ncbi:MAG: T9SS C-terminal target domain-containing protein [Flavobacteriales bacterium]|nr:hypothetical protein [Flavobacteriales bacterium]MCC6576213.1 T9SS C-terminal target domain-containing protein [Flavobacteriales bacterium]NUQ14979.1 T9SS C-terminal target domain-containing protein [Flavobacteriales bacterium]